MDWASLFRKSARDRLLFTNETKRIVALEAGFPSGMRALYDVIDDRIRQRSEETSSDGSLGANKIKSVFAANIIEMGHSEVNFSSVTFDGDRVIEVVRDAIGNGFSLKKDAASFEAAAALMARSCRIDDANRGDFEIFLPGAAIGVFSMICDGRFDVFERITEMSTPAIIYITRWDWVDRGLLGDMFWGLPLEAHEPLGLRIGKQYR